MIGLKEFHKVSHLQGIMFRLFHNGGSRMSPPPCEDFLLFCVAFYFPMNFSTKYPNTAVMVSTSVPFRMIFPHTSMGVLSRICDWDAT